MIRRKLKTNQKEFLLAGKSVFTVENSNVGNRFTYKVQKLREDRKRNPNDSDIWFVSVLTGPDNTADYTFIGSIRVNGDGGLNYYHSQKSRIARDAKSVRAFIWIMLNLDKLPPGYNFYHEGHCGRCGKPLTVPESIITGYGPVCMKGLRIPRPDKLIVAQFVAGNPDFDMKRQFAEHEAEMEKQAFENKMKKEMI